MTRTVVHSATFVAHAALHVRRFTARAGRSLCAAILARATRRALNGLPDDLLSDIGLARSDIPFVAAAVACGDRNPSREAPNRLDQTATQGSAMAHRLPAGGFRLALIGAATISTFVTLSHAVLAQDAQIKRGQYLVTLTSLPPVKNKVPGPFGPSEKPTSFVMKIVAPEAAAIASPTPK